MEKLKRSSVKSQATLPATGGKGQGLNLKYSIPTGSLEVAHLHAPRLAGLNGKTICELGDAKWEDHRIFPSSVSC